MRIEHVNLIVTDIERSLDFYRAALPHWRVRGGGTQRLDGVVRRWVHYGCDDRYIALYDGGAVRRRQTKSPEIGVTHFAFETRDLQALIERLAAAGFEPSDPGDVTRARRNVYFLDPDGLEVEFVQYDSDCPDQRNSYDASVRAGTLCDSDDGSSRNRP